MNANPCTSVAKSVGQLTADAWHIVAEQPAGVGLWNHFVPRHDLRDLRERGAVITTQRRDRKNGVDYFTLLAKLADRRPK